MATETISQDLADLLATKNFDPKYTDEKGMDTSPGEAVVFSFDWVGPSGKNYGTAVAVIGDENDLMFFFGDNLGKSIENPEDKEAWFKFLEEMSDFSTQHRYTWSPKDINQLKHTMAGMAAIKEGLFEGYYGTRKVSYMGEQTDARLVIKHNRMLGENDKRYRYVESLFIETADGERFKLPFTKLAGGRAMLEHVRQGGKPYDIRGSHICEMVTEMNLLARFNRASQNKVFEGHTQELVESAQNYYHTLQENLKHLSSSRGYSAYFESWSPADINSEDALVEDIKTLFVEQTLDARIESALPLLAKIQQGTAMKEVNVFETWINRMAEGTWALPDTPEQEARLRELMAQELPAGPDGTNATEQLYELVGDDQLFDLIQAAAAADPNANIWDNAEIVGRLGELGVDTSAITQRGAEQTPEPEGMAEGVATTMPELDAKNYLRKYGADHFQSTTNELHFYKNGRPFSVDLVMNPDATRSVTISSLNAARRGLTGQGVAEMDKSQPSHGRDGKISHSTYGSRDKGGSQGQDRTATPLKANWIDDLSLDQLNALTGPRYKKKNVKEGRMADTDAIIQSIIAGDIDPYDIMNHPQGPEEEYVAKIIQQEYEDVAIEHRLHPDDDFEQILDRVVDRLAQDYGHTMDEADTVHSFGETTVAGSVAPMAGELEEEDQWGQARQDPMNYNAAITGSYYESDDPLARLKTLALSK